MKRRTFLQLCSLIPAAFTIPLKSVFGNRSEPPRKIEGTIRGLKCAGVQQLLQSLGGVNIERVGLYAPGQVCLVHLDMTPNMKVSDIQGAATKLTAKIRVPTYTAQFTCEIHKPGWSYFRKGNSGPVSLFGRPLTEITWWKILDTDGKPLYSKFWPHWFHKAVERAI